MQYHRDKVAQIHEIQLLKAVIQDTNNASKSLFLSCGYTLTGKENENNSGCDEYIERLVYEKWLRK